MYGKRLVFSIFMEEKRTIGHATTTIASSLTFVTVHRFKLLCYCSNIRYVTVTNVVTDGNLTLHPFTRRVFSRANPVKHIGPIITDDYYGYRRK